MNQLACLDMADLNEIRLKRKDVGIAERKCLWSALPLDLPIGSRPPTISVDKEAEVGIIEQKLEVEALQVDRFHVLLPSHKV